MKGKILIAEDERRIARVVALELDHEGYETAFAETGKDALERIKGESWDLVLLDVMLPEMSGFEVLRRVRMEDQQTPIILVTARDSVYDKVNGLDHGANDYIAKPFEMEELLARVRSAIRTAETRIKRPHIDDLKKIGHVEVSLLSRTVTRNGESVELTKREFDLLVHLINHKNQVLTRDQLLEAVWGFEYAGETNVVDVYIGYLRKKIEHDFTQQLIHTVRGVGFTIREPKDEH